MKKKTAILKLVAKKKVSNEEGYILLMGLFVFIILLLMGIALAVMGMQEFDITARVKMMDQAYLIADGGVNAAAVALETNPSYRQALTPTYPTSPGIITGTSDFGGGTYTYWVYQSEIRPNDASYKVIKSKGIITKQNKTAERTILTRIVLAPGGPEYDASFDYLIYNGMDSNDDGVSEHGTWAPSDDGFKVKLPLGELGFDGMSSYQGHAPKGAFYVDGSINVPVSILGILNIKGRVVATDDIILKNSGAIHFGQNGIKVSGNQSVPGNVIAGLDGSGSATVEAVANGGFKSAINISGNVCAANDVTVTSSGSITFFDPLVVGGIRAGDIAKIEGSVNIGQPVQVTTNGIIAGDYVDVKSAWFTGVTINGNISGEGNLAIFSGSTTSGVGVSLKTTAASNITTGHIRSNGRVDLSAEYAGTNITVGSITAGNDDGSPIGGTGVYGYIASLGGFIFTPSLNVNGQINSAGKVKFETHNVASPWLPAECRISTQGINAGSNGGIGVEWAGDVFCNVTAGDVVSVGDITLDNTDGGKCTLGSLYSGGNITLGVNASWLTDIGDNSISITGTPAIRARGNCNILSTDNVTIQSGDVLVVGNIEIKSIAPVIGSNTIQVASGNTIYSGGSTTIKNDNFAVIGYSAEIGNIMSVGNIDVNSNDASNVGIFYAGNASNTSTLYFRCGANVLGGDSFAGNMWGTGKVTIRHEQDLVLGDLGTSGRRMGWIKSGTLLRMEPTNWFTDIWCNGMFAPAYELENGKSWANIDPYSGGPPPPASPGADTGVTTPVVATPSQPAKPAKPVVASPSDSTSGDVNMLREAGLSAPVKLLKPNWVYFETLARQNDIANGPETKICPNPNCRRTVNSTNPGSSPPVFPGTCPYCGWSITGVTPGPAHMIYDGGPGDQDHSTDGTIHFKWDNTTLYSSNETVFSSEPGVDIAIDVLNWDSSPSTYTGTIVARGYVYITAPTSAWVIDTGQNLNIVSGRDIINSSSGISLIQRKDAQLHLWAEHDINLENMNINLVGINSFLGSFTAGNRVVFNSNSIFEDTTFKWSRWALDPVAWAPPFKVLDWKEI